MYLRSHVQQLDHKQFIEAMVQDVKAQTTNETATVCPEEFVQRWG
jgi:hypothetical protein